MKERILRNWNFTRVLYLIMGCAVIVQSLISRQWLGIAFGGYFASMGLFAFGCASGNCFGSNCSTETSETKESEIQDIQFEEIKTK